MKILDTLKKNSPALSFEVFPPKKDKPFEPMIETIDRLAALKPSFISVTYGAGGGTSETTRRVAANILAHGTTPLAHLTCVGATEEKIRTELAALKSDGIENILALRGDPVGDTPTASAFAHASDLARFIRTCGDFALGGACYPECHPACEHLADDIANLRHKIDAGVGFLTTQMFFDNNIFYRYLAKVREAGICTPIIAGVMPVTNGRQIRRICELSHTYLPSRFKMIVDRFGERADEMFAAGVAYATEQIIDLFANGVNAVHLYTMNKPEVGEAIHANLKSILEGETK